MTKKILICTGIFPPEVGGPATYSKIVAEELVKRGHHVRVLTYSDKPQKDNYSFPVIRILRSGFKPLHYLKYFLAVQRYGMKADVLYAQDPVSAGYPTYLAARILKKPFAVKITGDYSWEQAHGRGLTEKMIDDFQTLKDYPPKVRRMRDIQIHVAKSADAVIVPSEYLKRLVMGWGVKEKNIAVIYNAVEMPEVKLTKDEARQKLGVKESNFLIVSSGRNVPWKGFEFLRKVNDKLESTNPDIILKMIYDAPRSELHENIRAADVYVLNTGYEGLSNTLVEVLRLGTPIITTNVGGNPEIIQNGVNGLLIEYNNAKHLEMAILQLYNHRELLKKLSENAPGTLGKFDLEKMINETERRLCAF